MRRHSTEMIGWGIGQHSGAPEKLRADPQTTRRGTDWHRSVKAQCRYGTEMHSIGEVWSGGEATH